MARRDPDIHLSADESKKLAYGAGKVSIVIAVLCFLLMGALWQPVSAIYGASHPWSFTLLELGVWFSVTAWLCFKPPFNGIILLLGGVVVLLILWNANGAAHTYQQPWPVAAGALSFTVGGLFMMLVAKISTETHWRLPYWQEAWPGVVLVVAGLIAAGILLVALPKAPLWLPGGVVPAESG
jgi:hypothetical protein